MPAPKSWLFKMDGVPFQNKFEANGSVVAGYYNATLGRPNTFDAFLFHATWNHEEIRRIVPKGPAFTILRDPVNLFESGYAYFGYQPKVQYIHLIKIKYVHK